jgi:hypothetical protein
MARQHPPHATRPRRRRWLNSWRIFMAIVVAMLLGMAAVGWLFGGSGPPVAP